MMLKRFYSDFNDIETDMNRRKTNLVHQFNNPYRHEYLHEIPESRVFLIQTRFEVDFLRYEVLADPEYFVVLTDKNGDDLCRHLVLLDDKRYNNLYSERWPYIMYRSYAIDIIKNLPNANELPKFFIKLPFGYEARDYNND